MNTSINMRAFSLYVIATCCLAYVSGLGVPGEYYPKVQWSDPGTTGQTAADLDEVLGYNLTHLAPWRKILRHDQITNLHRPYGLHPFERASPIWRLKADADGGFQEGADGEMSWTDGRDPTPFPGRCIDLEDRGVTTYYRHTLPNGEWLPTQNPYERPNATVQIRHEHVYWVSRTDGSIVWDLGNDASGNEITPAGYVRPLWEGEPPVCEVETNLLVYSTEGNQNANGGGPIPGFYSDSWDWDFDNNGFPETRKGGEGCQTWWDGRGGFNNEWNQCESGVCRDYAVYQKTSIWFVAPADGGYSPMRPADTNTELNMGKKCQISSNTHACKGPGGVEDNTCHAIGFGTEDDGATCESTVSETSDVPIIDMVIKGGDPSGSYALVGWFSNKEDCMNVMASDTAYDKWRVFTYGYGNKCNSDGDCKCYAMWDNTVKDPTGDVLVGAYYYGGCSASTQGSAYADGSDCASSGYNTYELDRNRKMCEYRLGTCRQGEGCGDSDGCLDSSCIQFKSVYDTGTNGHCAVSSLGKLCAGKMGEVCLESSDCASNNCGFIAGKKVCLGDYGDPCEAASQCGQFARCKGNVCCRDVDETNPAVPAGEHLFQCMPGSGYAGICEPGADYVSGFGCKRLGCNLAADRVIEGERNGLVSHIEPSYCDVFYGDYDPDTTSVLPNINTKKLTYDVELGSTYDMLAYGDLVQQKESYGKVIDYSEEGVGALTWGEAKEGYYCGGSNWASDAADRTFSLNGAALCKTKCADTSDCTGFSVHSMSGSGIYTKCVICTSTDIPLDDSLPTSSGYMFVRYFRPTTTIVKVKIAKGYFTTGIASIKGNARNIVGIEAIKTSIKDTSTASTCPNAPAIYTGTAHVGILPTDITFQARHSTGQSAIQLFGTGNPDYATGVKIGTYGSCARYPTLQQQSDAYTAYSHKHFTWPQEAVDQAGQRAFYDKKQCLDKIMSKDNMEIGECGSLWGDRREAVEWLGGINEGTGQLEVNPDDESMYRYQLSQCDYKINCGIEGCVRDTKKAELPNLVATKAQCFRGTGDAYMSLTPYLPQTDEPTEAGKEAALRACQSMSQSEFNGRATHILFSWGLPCASGEGNCDNYPDMWVNADSKSSFNCETTVSGEDEARGACDCYAVAAHPKVVTSGDNCADAGYTPAADKRECSMIINGLTEAPYATQSAASDDSSNGYPKECYWYGASGNGYFNEPTNVVGSACSTANPCLCFEDAEKATQAEPACIGNTYGEDYSKYLIPRNQFQVREPQPSAGKWNCLVIDPAYTGVDNEKVNLCNSRDIYGLADIYSLAELDKSKLPWGNPHDGTASNFNTMSNKYDKTEGYHCSPKALGQNIQYACDKFNPFWDLYELGRAVPDTIEDKGKVCGGGGSQYSEKIYMNKRYKGMVDDNPSHQKCYKTDAQGDLVQRVDFEESFDDQYCAGTNWGTDYAARITVADMAACEAACAASSTCNAMTYLDAGHSGASFGRCILCTSGGDLAPTADPSGYTTKIKYSNSRYACEAEKHVWTPEACTWVQFQAMSGSYSNENKLVVKDESGAEIYKITGLGVGYSMPNLVTCSQVTSSGSECLSSFGSVGDSLTTDDSCYSTSLGCTASCSGSDSNSYYGDLCSADYSDITSYRVKAGARRMCLPNGYDYYIEMYDSYGNAWDGAYGAAFCVATVSMPWGLKTGQLAVTSYTPQTTSVSVIADDCLEGKSSGDTPVWTTVNNGKFHTPGTASPDTCSNPDIDNEAQCIKSSVNKWTSYNREGFIVDSAAACNRVCRENKPCRNFAFSEDILTGKANTLTYDSYGHNEQGMSPCMLEVSSARKGLFRASWNEAQQAELTGEWYWQNQEQGFGEEIVLDFSTKGNDNVAPNDAYCSQEQALWGYPGSFMDYPAARNAMKAHTMAECAVATGMLGGVHFTFVGAENKKSGTGKDYHLPPLDENGRVPAGAKYVAWPADTECPYYPGPLLKSDGSLDMETTHPYFLANGGGTTRTDVQAFYKVGAGICYSPNWWNSNTQGSDYGVKTSQPDAASCAAHCRSVYADPNAYYRDASKTNDGAVYDGAKAFSMIKGTTTNNCICYGSCTIQGPAITWGTYEVLEGTENRITNYIADGTYDLYEFDIPVYGIQPEDADNVEKYPNECIQCFPSFDLGGNSGSSAHQSANPTGKNFLPWPPVGASISNVSPIACLRGSRPNLFATFARTFRIAANVQKDYNTKVSGKNTGDTKLSKYECEKFASKYAIPFRVLWDPDSTSGGCWPYCIDLATMPIGCIYDSAQDEVRYIEVDIPGYEGQDCSTAQRCLVKPKYNGHYMDYKKTPGAHDFHHKWRFRKQYERKYREIEHSNNKDYPAGHWAEYGDRKIKFAERYGKSNRKIEQGRTCREASQALYGHQSIYLPVRHPTATSCWGVVPIPDTTAIC